MMLFPQTDEDNLVTIEDFRGERGSLTQKMKLPAAAQWSLQQDRPGIDRVGTRLIQDPKSPDVYTEHNLTAASSGLTPDIESTVDSILQQGSFWNT
jgi:hypothetical protein